MTSSPQLALLLSRKPDLVACAESILAAHAVMSGAVRTGNKLLLCGNGGSAADADHWAGELLKGFRRTRPLPAAMQDRLPPESRARLQGSIPAIPLGGFTAALTAFSNDVDPVLAYAQITCALGRPGDVFIGLSTSGNAANVCAAARVARALGLQTIGLTGRSGGALRGECDVCIGVPATETYQIQEFHLPVYHCLSLMLEDEFFLEGEV